MFSGLLDFLFGKAHDCPLEQRIVTMVSLLASATGLLLTILNILLANPAIHSLFSLLVALGGALFYLLSRKGIKYEPVAAAMFIFYLLLILAGWYAIDGSYGPQPYFLFMVYIFGMIVLKRTLRIAALATVPIITLLLLVHEYHNPELLKQYATQASRYLDLASALAICMTVTGLLVFLIVQEHKRERRKNAELLIEALKNKTELEAALEEIKVLEGYIPICSGCKKIRDDEGFWQEVTTYISKRTDTQFSHSLCPQCIETLYPEYSNTISPENDIKPSGP